MITLRKLQSLAPGTRLRKAASLLQGFEQTLQDGVDIDTGYTKELLVVLAGEECLPRMTRDRFAGTAERLNTRHPGDEAGVSRQETLRDLNACRHLLLQYLGAEPADWDFPMQTQAGPQAAAASDAGGPAFRRFPFGLYLDDIRSPFNVGSIFRTAEAFGASLVVLSPDTPDPESGRACRASMGATCRIPWERQPGKWLAHRKAVFAVELGGDPVDRFRFPDEGIAVFGSEELGCSPEALSYADAGRVSIPLYGSKGSLNVGVACGIVMHLWSQQYSIRHAGSGGISGRLPTQRVAGRR